MTRIRAAVLGIASLFSLLTNKIIRHSTTREAEEGRRSLGALASLVPGGFIVGGTCDLRDMGEKKSKVDLGMFVKHGLHATMSLLPEDCAALGLHAIVSGSAMNHAKVPWYPTWTVGEFVESSNEHKILAVRDSASFYKSVFNHVCNKMTKFKADWRRDNDVDCGRSGEFSKLLQLSHKQELARSYSPFLLKEDIMESVNVKKIMLVDYTCIPKVITSLCGGPAAQGYDSMGGEMSNSAASQNYKDFWSMHNHSVPLNEHSQFWDEIHVTLKEKCCIELVKPS